MVYQNFLMEFWSTDVAFDSFPSTGEPKKCPLIKFSILNGQRPLTRDFNTFCSSTGLNYNNDKYVDHPTPEVVKKELGKLAINPSYLDKTPVLKNSFPVAWIILFTFVIQVLGGNYSSTKQVNSIQQLFAYSLITGTEVDIGEIIYRDLDPSKVTDNELTAHMIAVNNQRDLVSPPPLAAKPKKGKSQTVTSTLPQSQGPDASEALFKKRKQPESKRPSTETKESPPKPMEASTGLPSTLDEGTRQSKPLPEGTATHPKDSGGNKQPLDRDITSTTSDEGTAKTTPRPEVSLGDKDSEGNIPPADMEPIHTPVADPSRVGAKYQVDETQSTRLRYRSLIENEGKTSSEVEPDIKPLQLQTFADIQAYLLSEDELDKECNEEEVLATGDDMDEDIQAVEEEAAVSYADLKASIDQYYNENLAHRDQTEKLMEASTSSLDRSITTISDLYKGLDVISQLLKDISNVVKDDPAANQKLNEATETFAHALKQEEASAAWTKSSTNMAWNLGSRMTAVEISQTALKREVSSLRQDTSEIKSMIAETYQAFKGQPASGNDTPTLALTHILANVEGGNATNTATKEPPTHTEGETRDGTMAILISSIQPTHA
ncbi:hypothetical protein Tco_0442281 [Tanacetum coccineum]